jgi:predicted DNA-binding antitoxin AbrB/MazE fold protein
VIPAHQIDRLGYSLYGMSPRIVEATYEDGLLRPLELIQDSGNQIYLVTILDRDIFNAKARPQGKHSLRGRYRGYLSSVDAFSRSKQTEKTLER